MDLPFTPELWPSLKDWFIREGVEYPWGDHPDSYSVWISEIMLQQTQVKAVIPYFMHWMQEYPDIAALAGSSEEKVTRSWEGLGYYSRARNILKTARILQDSGATQLPADYHALIKLPGIGPYTAAAVLSIAFGLNFPVMDANVRRICHRLCAEESWTTALETRWTGHLTSLIRGTSEPGIFNCAMMQLGQLICRKSNPQCEKCPLNRVCRAWREDRTEEIPPVKKKKIKQWDSRALVFLRDQKVFLEFRDKGIGKGLWSLPRIPADQDLPQGWNLERELTTRSHHFTTNREILHPLVLVPRQDEQAGDSVIHQFDKTCWQPVERISEPAMPAVYRRILEEFRLLYPSY